ncbi:MAG: NAD(P)-dependent oxidoreductase [Candidatus Saccharicenans sp.]|jgi:nucleoside-diphosphate-sugar epimerase|nr:NAD(P)-dependent oxidoreductase [Candidatus Saccharicenans sp.]MDH7575355.1 NAD(P)-dependent oxidoreductase [Candidatus Saccharicenans sp.]
MGRYLITGGSGYFGSLLIEYLLSQGHECINIDIYPQTFSHQLLKSFEIDIRNYSKLKEIFLSEGPFDCVFHVAALLAHSVKDKKSLIETNVNGTENVARLCAELNIKNLVFTSSNCLWARPFGRPVTEDDQPEPVEVYGLSKLQAEQVLFKYANKINSAILRVPTIISSGRLGLLAILFEFIEENKIIWIVGNGQNRYQFIYGPDLARAALLSSTIKETRIYNVGSDEVKSLKEIYQYVIDKAGSKARIKSLPRGPALLAMKLAHLLGVSPLGPYHYRMIAESFEFETLRIKRELGWQPTKSNEEMLFEAYQFYKDHKDEIKQRHKASAHRKAASMGVIKLIKWLS